MKASTQRIIDTLIDNDDYQEVSLGVLLYAILSLKTTKGASFKEIHSVLAAAYMNVAEAENVTLSTHL